MGRKKQTNNLYAHALRSTLLANVAYEAKHSEYVGGVGLVRTVLTQEKYTAYFGDDANAEYKKDEAFQFTPPPPYKYFVIHSLLASLTGKLIQLGSKFNVIQDQSPLSHIDDLFENLTPDMSNRATRRLNQKTYLKTGILRGVWSCHSDSQRKDDPVNVMNESLDHPEQYFQRLLATIRALAVQIKCASEKKDAIEEHLDGLVLAAEAINDISTHDYTGEYLAQKYPDMFPSTPSELHYLTECFLLNPDNRGHLFELSKKKASLESPCPSVEIPIPDNDSLGSLKIELPADWRGPLGIDRFTRSSLCLLGATTIKVFAEQLMDSTGASLLQAPKRFGQKAIYKPFHEVKGSDVKASWELDPFYDVDLARLILACSFFIGSHTATLSLSHSAVAHTGLALLHEYAANRVGGVTNSVGYRKAENGHKETSGTDFFRPVINPLSQAETVALEYANKEARKVGYADYDSLRKAIEDSFGSLDELNDKLEVERGGLSKAWSAAAKASVRIEKFTRVRESRPDLLSEGVVLFIKRDPKVSWALRNQYRRLRDQVVNLDTFHNDLRGLESMGYDVSLIRSALSGFRPVQTITAMGWTVDHIYDLSGEMGINYADNLVIMPHEDNANKNALVQLQTEDMKPGEKRAVLTWIPQTIHIEHPTEGKIRRPIKIIVPDAKTASATGFAL